MTKMSHPAEAQLALYAGKDLGFWAQRRIRGHVLNCARCQREIHALQRGTGQLLGLAAELPPDLNWTRLAQEMTGNIRVGFAAGECIDGFEKTMHSGRPRLPWQAAGVFGAATAIAAVTLWFSLPDQRLNHLVSSLGQIRWERLGTTFRGPALAESSVVLEASTSGIEVKSNGHALSMMHPRSDGATVSVNMQDSAGVRFVDADSGQATMNTVYYAQ